MLKKIQKTLEKYNLKAWVMYNSENSDKYFCKYISRNLSSSSICIISPKDIFILVSSLDGENVEKLKYNADKIKIFGAVMFERILDMIVICSMLLFAICVYHRNELAVRLCLLAFLMLILCLVFAVVTYKYKKIDTVCNFLNRILSKFTGGFAEKGVNFVNKISNSFCGGFEILDSPKRIFFALMTSYCIWIFECVNTIIVISAFNCPVHWSVCLFSVSFIVFACLIPSTSIFIGPYQVAVIAAFALYGIAKETALAMSFTMQAVVTLTDVTIAIIFLFKNNISLNKFKEEIK